jgi:hypothetical protein
MDASLDIHAGGSEVPAPANFRWPGGKRIAVFFRVSFEWWSDGKWPGIGPMGNPLKPGIPDLNAYIPHMSGAVSREFPELFFGEVAL